MNEHPSHDDSQVSSDVAHHVSEARQRARQVFGSEAHLAAVDDWRRAIISARDALILIWLIWLALEGFGSPPWCGLLLVALAVAIALLDGISTGRSTYLQVQYYEAELDRERTEIRETFKHECEEVRALYAAKGFREPLLGQIVDTLTSDEDRLLKVMMEEELGLSMQHINHPLLVGLWNFAAAAAAGIALALPVVWLDAAAARVWMPAGGAVLLAALSIVTAKVTRRNVIEIFATGVIMAAITGGTVYMLAKWLAS
ncbi:MAG: VIT1/CCC1 transporter family protein [Planctomycetota bacterium]|jgi:VIT1/CCC1 family predicted Fe2+/Mn2+ transporter